MKKLDKPTTNKNQHQVLLRLAIVSAGLLLAGLCAHANPTLPTIPSGTFDITSYGASTSSSDNSTAIQNTIKAAAAAGGGTVQVPSGTFLSGPLSLSNSINLNLASGAELKLLPYGTYPTNAAPFVAGKNLINVEVSGPGTIEGQGSNWWTAYGTNNSLARPELIQFQSCTNMEVADVHLQNAPTGHLVFNYYCSQGTISNVTISTYVNGPNTDGIDIEGNNFLIENCNIADGDDNIAIGAGHLESSYFTIQNCAFGTGHGCSIGSYTTYGVDHLLVTNCTFNGTFTGVRMKSAQGRGGTVQYCNYYSLTMTNVQHPIWIDSLYPNADPSNPTTVASNSVTSTTPIWKHISFTGVTANCTVDGGTIYGLPEEYVGSIGLTNVNITAPIGMIIYYAGPISFSGSSVSASSGYPVTIYDATVSGISTHTY